MYYHRTVACGSNKLASRGSFDYNYVMLIRTGELNGIFKLYTSRVHRCWLCSSTFINKSELNKHLSGKAHTRLAVICPWCLGRQKIFTRVSDLKNHVKSSHTATLATLPINFFTVATGFFMAIHPNDYQQIGSLGDYEAEESFQARKAVLRWCSSQPNAVKVTETWRKAWLVTKKIKTLIDATPAKRSAPEDDLGEEPEVSVGEPMKKAKVLSLPSVDTSVSPSDSTEETTTDQHVETPEEDMEESPFETNTGDSRMVVDSAGACPPPVEQPGLSGSAEFIALRTESIQSQAEHLLRYGQMPVFAPGRREWSKGGLLQLELESGKFTWPPMNWTQYTPDQKLLASEFAAMSIESKTTGSFPTLSRGNLLDKFNFLVLPGSAKARRSAEEARQHKSRFYTYQELRRIALSPRITMEDSAFVRFYRQSMHVNQTDDLVNAIEALRVPLRLHTQ